MLDWQPVERPEKWSGVGSTSSLADDPGEVVLRSLQYTDVDTPRTFTHHFLPSFPSFSLEYLQLMERLQLFVCRILQSFSTVMPFPRMTIPKIIG